MNKAIDVSRQSSSISKEDIGQPVENFYNYAPNDLLMFMYTIMYYLGEEETNAANFLEKDLDEKKEYFDNE